MTIRSTRSRAKQVSQDVHGDEYWMTPAQMREYQLCFDDPIYFINRYLKIHHPTRGVIPFILRDYQERQCMILEDMPGMICVQPRQSGATLLPLAFLLWESLFKTGQTLGAAFVKHVSVYGAKQQIDKWLADVPAWMQPKTLRSTRTGIEFDNHSQIFFGQINGNFARGRSLNRIFADSFAIAADQDQDDFLNYSLPALLTSNGKMALISTPNGKTNKFAEVWNLARAGGSAWTSFHVKAHEVHSPATLAHLLNAVGQRTYDQEVEGKFV